MRTVEEMKREKGELEYELRIIVNEFVYGYVQSYNPDEFYWLPGRSNPSKWCKPEDTPAYNKGLDWLITTLKEFSDKTKENNDGKESS